MRMRCRAISDGYEFCTDCQQPLKYGHLRPPGALFRNTGCAMLQHLTCARRAITLVELITVLLIMLLLMSISVPLILYFGRTNRDQGQVDGLARYLGSNQFQAILLRQPRGIKLSRNAGPDSPLPPNSSWFNRVEFVELYHDFAMRDASLALGWSRLRALTTSPTGQVQVQVISRGWAMLPSLVQTNQGRTVYHPAVVSLYVPSGNQWVAYQHGLTSSNWPNLTLFIEFAGQGQTRQAIPPLSPNPPAPLLDPYTFPPTAAYRPYPTTPVPSENPPIEVFDPIMGKWDQLRPGEEPILQSHQLYLVDPAAPWPPPPQLPQARPVSVLFLQEPNPISLTSFNYSLYSLADTRISNVGDEFLKEPVVVDSTRCVPANIDKVIFSYDRSVLFPSEGQLSGRTINGWIVFWVGPYEEQPPGSGQWVIKPEKSTLVCIHAKTGRIRQFPVNTDSSLGDAYYYVRLGQ